MLDDKFDLNYGVKHDYLYGNEMEMYSFFRIPKILIEHPAYSGMSAEAKLLYGCFLDRSSLSVINDWKDENGRIYIVFQFEDVKSILGCSNQKAGKVLTELEDEYNLINRKKQGLGKPNLIYVKKILLEMSDSKVQSSEKQNSCSMKIRVEELSELESKNSENQSSVTLKNEVTELRKSNSNNTNINNTDINNTESISSESAEDEMAKRKQYEEYFEKSLSVKQLIDEYPTKKEILQEIVDVILDVMCTNQKSIRISRDEKPKEIVHSQFMKLNEKHLRHVLDVLGNSSNIRNMKQYILATLYNASMTINNCIVSQQNCNFEKEEVNAPKDYFGYFGPETQNKELLDNILKSL